MTINENFAFGELRVNDVTGTLRNDVIDDKLQLNVSWQFNDKIWCEKVLFGVIKNNSFNHACFCCSRCHKQHFQVGESTLDTFLCRFIFLISLNSMSSLNLIFFSGKSWQNFVVKIFQSTRLFFLISWISLWETFTGTKAC